MPLKINVKTKIKFNGQEYNSVEDMPTEARQTYERALAAFKSDPAAQSRSTTKIVFNGREYGSVADMPADVRQLYEQVMGAVDADRNGIPDVLESAGQAPTPSLPPAPTEKGADGSASANIITVIAVVVIVIALLALAGIFALWILSQAVH